MLATLPTMVGPTAEELPKPKDHEYINRVAVRNTPTINHNHVPLTRWLSFHTCNALLQFHNELFDNSNGQELRKSHQFLGKSREPVSS